MRGRVSYVPLQLTEQMYDFAVIELLIIQSCQRAAFWLPKSQLPEWGEL
jgi:hypothetical protein